MFLNPTLHSELSQENMLSVHMWAVTIYTDINEHSYIVFLLSCKRKKTRQ